MTRSARERKAIAIAFLLVLIVFLTSFIQAKENLSAPGSQETGSLSPDISK